MNRTTDLGQTCVKIMHKALSDIDKRQTFYINLSDTVVQLDKNQRNHLIAGSTQSMKKRFLLEVLPLG